MRDLVPMVLALLAVEQRLVRARRRRFDGIRPAHTPYRGEARDSDPSPARPPIACTSVRRGTSTTMRSTTSSSCNRSKTSPANRVLPAPGAAESVAAPLFRSLLDDDLERFELPGTGEHAIIGDIARPIPQIARSTPGGDVLFDEGTAMHARAQMGHMHRLERDGLLALLAMPFDRANNRSRSHGGGRARGSIESFSFTSELLYCMIYNTESLVKKFTRRPTENQGVGAKGGSERGGRGTEPVQKVNNKS